MVDREEFTALLATVSASTVEFARRYVTNSLPDSYKYHLMLNPSCDDHVASGEVLYPEDDGVELSELDASRVVDLLSREQKCPAWIDISVEAASPHYSLLRLICCGRFTGDISRLYYGRQGAGPFGIKSPDLPPGFSDGQLFALRVI